MLSLLLLMVSLLAVRDRFDREVARSVPGPPAADLSFRLVCLAPVDVTVTAGLVRLPWRTTLRALAASPTMWQRMHLADWNRVPPTIREIGLDAMLAHYRDVLLRPDRWDAMQPADWDVTPQPIRTVAFRRMTAYWAGYYRLGLPHGLPATLLAETLAAIVMSESWFDHRAVARSSGGDRDLGLGQASPFARRRLRQLHGLGAVDIAFRDDEYFDPWKASRFAAVWLMLMLDEARGDLELAVRAYHRGMADALDGAGDAYAATVQQRLRRYIRNLDAPVAWDYLWRRARRLSAPGDVGADVPVAGTPHPCRPGRAGRAGGGRLEAS